MSRKSKTRKTATAPQISPSAAEDDVGAALNLLRDALAEEAGRINEEGAKAMKAGDYATAEGVIDFAKRLLSFRSKVEGLGKEWEGLEGLREEASTEVQKIVSKRFFGKATGDITTQAEYCRPILEVLVELGGSAPMKKVLDRVGEKMNGILKPKDYQPQASDPKQIRWRNIGQWARNTMANEDGRMKKNSPRGLWEISDAGRVWLKQQ